MNLCTDRNEQGLQFVHLGKTWSGQPGLFTGSTMAMPLTREQFAVFSEDQQQLEDYCQRMGFALEN